MGTIAKERILEFRGDDLVDREGAKIGTIDEIYLDADTGEPEWALITTGLFGTKRTFVPLAEVTEEDGSLCVPHTKDTVKEAPQMEAAGQLTKDQEAALYAHYGIQMPSPPEG